MSIDEDANRIVVRIASPTSTASSVAPARCDVPDPFRSLTPGTCLRAGFKHVAVPRAMPVELESADESDTESGHSFRMHLSKFRVRTSHTRFCIGYALALFVICNAINIDKLAKWFRQGDGLDYPALAAYLAAGLCLFIVVFTLLAHRLTLKPL